MGDIPYTGHYARLHHFTDAYYDGMARSYRRFIHRYLPQNKQARILDVGCGTGFLLNAIRRAGYSRSEGIDADRGQVKIGRDRGLPIQHVDVWKMKEYLTAKNGTVDAIVFVDVLEHIRKDEQIPTLKAIYSALAPGGRLICQVPNALFVVGLYNRYMDWTHECLFSSESLAFVVENSGFTIERIEGGHDKPSPPRSILLNMLMSGFRSLLQFLTGMIWRLTILSWWGPAYVRHPIRANLIVVAVKER